MKARISVVFATAIVALAVAGSALAAPHQNAIKAWDYTRPSATAGWTSYHPGTVKPWTIRGWGYKPNPTCIRGTAVKGW